MSRVGKMPIALPKDAEATVTAEQITVKGPLGTLSQALNGLVKINNVEGTLSFEPANDSREANAMSGTLRALVNNMVNGVTKGFEVVFGRRGLSCSSARRQAEPVARFFAPGSASDAAGRQVRNAVADRDRDQRCE
jgi:hypothetical protein